MCAPLLMWKNKTRRNGKSVHGDVARFKVSPLCFSSGVQRWLYSELGLWVGVLVQKRKILGEPCTSEVTTQECTRTKKGGSNRHKQNKTVSRGEQQKHVHISTRTHIYISGRTHLHTHLHGCTTCTYIYRQWHVNIRTYMHANICMYAHRYA